MGNFVYTLALERERRSEGVCIFVAFEFSFSRIIPRKILYLRRASAEEEIIFLVART